MRATRLALAVSWAVPLAVFASCGVDELDLTGKACPCASSYVCDVSSNTCVLGLSPIEGGATLDGGGPTDAAIEPERNPSARLDVTALKAVWSTPNNVRWEWTLDGKADDFQAMTLSFATKSDDIAGGRAQVLTYRERPELGRFDARGNEPAGPVTIWTSTDVNAGSMQFAQVKVTDKNGQSNVSATVLAMSQAAFTQSRTLFDGVDLMTATDFTFRPSFDDYSYVVACGGAGSPCGKRPQLALTTDLSPFTNGDFARAYLEVIVEGNVGTTIFDSTVSIQPGNGSCTSADCFYGYRGWTQSTAANAAPDRIQVPLAKLVNPSGAALPLTALQPGYKVSALVFSGIWKDATVLRLKSAKIRW